MANISRKKNSAYETNCKSLKLRPNHYNFIPIWSSKSQSVYVARAVAERSFVMCLCVC